jgi:uncharacterized membrane protein YccC
LFSFFLDRADGWSGGTRVSCTARAHAHARATPHSEWAQAAIAIKDLEAKLQRLQEELAQREDDVARLKAGFLEKETLVLTLQREIEAGNSQSDTQTRTIEELTVELQALRTELQSLQDEIHQRDLEMQELNNTVRKQGFEIATLDQVTWPFFLFFFSSFFLINGVAYRVLCALMVCTRGCGKGRVCVCREAVRCLLTRYSPLSFFLRSVATRSSDPNWKPVTMR